MSSFFSNRWVQLAVRLILGASFLYAGISKIQAPLAFADNIADFKLLINSLVTPLAISLPVLEMFVGVMLITGFEAGVAAFSGMILTSVFALALVSALIRGLKIDCGCFGSGSASTFRMWFALVRDLLFGVMAWAVLMWNFRASDKVPEEVKSQRQPGL